MVAYICWQVASEGQEGHLLSALDPGLQLLCHGAADRDRSIQVRRGVRAEGRVRFDASENDAGVALFVPDIEMYRPRREQPPAEAHLESAYGFAPKSPLKARQFSGTYTNDPERMPQSKHNNNRHG